MKTILLLVATLLVGCASTPGGGAASSAWNFYNDHYDRELAVGTSADGKPTVSYSIKPKQQAMLSDSQVKELMSHFAEYAAKDGKSVVKAEDAK